MVASETQRAPMIHSPGADDRYQGFTNVERRPDGMIMLEKTVDFSHPKAPAAVDIRTRGAYRGLGKQQFLVTEREAYILHRGT